MKRHRRFAARRSTRLSYAVIHRATCGMHKFVNTMLRDNEVRVRYCRGSELLVPRMKASISSGVSFPSLLLSIALKIRSCAI